MNKLFQISVVSLILISNYVVGQQKLSLNDAVKITLENNLDIIVAKLKKNIAKKNVALKCVNTFLNTDFDGGRHTRRVKKI